MKDGANPDPVAEGVYLNPVTTLTHLSKLISGALLVPVHRICRMYDDGMSSHKKENKVYEGV